MTPAPGWELGPAALRADLERSPQSRTDHGLPACPVAWLAAACLLPAVTDPRPDRSPHFPDPQADQRQDTASSSPAPTWEECWWWEGLCALQGQLTLTFCCSGCSATSLVAAIAPGAEVSLMLVAL